jgi:uncharacterized protein YkwD
MTQDTDVNDDGRLDLLDVATVRMAYGTADPQADVDGSGKVDLRDLSITRRYAFTNAVGTPKWDAEEEIFFAALNDYRAHPERWQRYTNEQGVAIEPDRTRRLQPLARSARLSEAAQWMATDCAEKNYLSHNDSLGRDAGARVVAFWYEARYGYTGEIALGTDGGGSYAGGYHSFVRWSLSPSHNGIMLGDYVSVGVGHAIGPPSVGTARRHRWFADFSTKSDAAPWPS